MEEALATLLVASALLCAVLTALTIARKLRRDRHEAHFLARRAKFRDLLLRGTSQTLGVELRRTRRDQRGQFDLLIALNAAWPQLDDSRHDVLRDAIVLARVDSAFTKQLGSRDPVRRATAALLVGRLRLPDAPHLVAPLVRDRDGDVRLAAVRALGELANQTAAYVLIDALGTRRLEPERVIERLGDKWAVPAMLDVLETGGRGARPIDEAADRSISWKPILAPLARALGLAGDRSAEPALLSILRIGGLEERIGATRALGPAGTAAAVPDLEAALEDTEWQVRAQAARSLALLGSTSAVPALAEHLSDSAWWVRAAAAEALVQLGDPGLAVLRDALVHSDRYARDRAREALALHGLGTFTG